MRLFNFLLFFSLSLAAKLIETTALLPCQKVSEFSARKFNVKFFPENRTANLDVEIVSAIDGNFTVDLKVYVYGIKAFETSLTGCDLSKTVCPISPGRFDVQYNLTIPEEYVKNVPGVAYTIPNIDAYVSAQVYYVDEQGNKKGNNSVACVVAQLSNDKSVYHNYVGWILFAITMVGLVVAVFAYLGGHYRTANHIISNTFSLFTYFQSIAIIAMMAVERLPPIAAAWAQNFEWSLGIISVGFMQKAVSWYVRSTSGTSTNILSAKDRISIAVYKRSLPDVKSYALKAAERAPHLAKRLSVSLSSNLTTTNESGNIFGKVLVLQGIKRVSYLANIELSNFFLTGTAFFLFIGIILVIILMLFKLGTELLVRLGALKSDRLSNFRKYYRGYTKGTLFRYFYIGFTQLSLLCLWEFTYRESAASVVIAVIVFAITLISLLVGGAKVIILGLRSTRLHKNPASILFGNSDVLYRWGFMYFQYNALRYWFLIPSIVYNFARSATIALGQSNGKAQAIVILVIELIYFIILCVLRPYADKKTNGYNIALSVFAIINAIFFLFFSRIFGPHVDVAAAIIGVVYFVMNAVVCCVYLIFLVFTCLWAIFNPRPDDRYRPVTDDRNMFMPDDGYSKDQTELEDLGNTARNGYRHSYLMYDPAHGHKGPGASPSGNLNGYNNQYVPHDMPKPQDASRNGPSEFTSYRDLQSRGINPETKLI